MKEKNIGIQFLEQESGIDKTPQLKKIGFTLNYKCDGNCSYCFIKPDIASKNANITDEIFIGEFQEILKQAIPLGLEEIQLSGGEPLLKKDILELIKIAKNLGLRVGIFTNGSMLNEEILEKLRLLKIDWIRVGLGGSDYKMSQRAGRLNDTKERFDKILNNIKSSVNAGFITGVFTPVTKNNYKDIRKTAALAKDLGVKYIIFCNYILLGNEQDRLNEMGIEEHYKAIEEILKARKEQKNFVDVYAYYGFFEYLSPNWKESDSNSILKGPCGRERLAFIANGDIRTCLCTSYKLDTFRKKDFNLGNIWKHPPFLIEIRKNKKFEPCLHCKKISICSPCLTSTMSAYKKINMPPAQCPAVREYELLKKTTRKEDTLKKALRGNLR